MTWIAVALAGAVLFSFVDVLDKRLLSRYMPGVLPFTLLVGTIQLAWGLGLLGVLGVRPEVGALPLGLGFLSGVLAGVALLFYFSVLRRGEVSRTVPVFQSYPIFAAILAVVFLDERLVPLQWVAIVMTVAGAVLISLQRPGASRGKPLGRGFFILVASSVFLGGSYVITKVALQDMSLGAMYPVRTIGLAACLITFSLRPPVVRQAVTFLRGHQGGVRLFALTEVVLSPMGVLVVLWAVSLGPVSLVSALLASRPLFVFLLSVVLSLGLWPGLDEPLSRKTLGVKLAAIGLIVGGVTAISLL